MNTLSKEIRAIQNPALGALLLWRFSKGYEKGSENQASSPLPLLFLVMPILLHPQMSEFVRSTQEASGLRAFAGKFTTSKESKNDLLLSINKRAIRMRHLTLKSLTIAIATHLITVVHEEGTVLSLNGTFPISRLPKTIVTLVTSAEKLGIWFSLLSLHEISIILKVRF